MFKKKIIAIYGTGVDGRRLHRILRKKKNLKIVCFLDTNFKLNNKKFFNIPVYEPKKNPNILAKLNRIYLGGRYMDDQEQYLKRLKFNGKIIRTNRWEYTYSKKDILIREKILLKILKKLLSVFEKNKINYVIDGSSLLAINRNQKLAEFTDVDISIIDNEVKIRKLLNLIKKQNLFSKKTYVFHKRKHFLFKKGTFLQCVLTSKCNSYKREPVNIEFYKEEIMQKNYYRFISPNLVSKIPEAFRKNIKYKIYNNIKLKVPKNSHKYLEWIYGKGWYKKNQNWKNTDSKKRINYLSNLKKR